jgi:hypothetical protein
MMRLVIIPMVWMSRKLILRAEWMMLYQRSIRFTSSSFSAEILPSMGVKSFLEASSSVIRSER